MHYHYCMDCDKAYSCEGPALKPGMWWSRDGIPCERKSGEFHGKCSLCRGKDPSQTSKV